MKRFYIFFTILISGILLLNCSVKVRHEYDKKINFSKYKTYTWISDKPVDRSVKAAKLIETAIKEQLNAKGYTHGLTEEAEFGVMYYGGVKGNVDVVDYDFSAWRTDYGKAGSGSPVYQEGTLFIEIVDMKKRMMVWRGWAGVFIDDSSDMEKVIDEIVRKILERFPPQ